MQPQYFRAKQITSSSATAEKVHVYKSGINQGKKRLVRAKPQRTGLLPISEKTLWSWVKDGKFPKPIRLSGNVTVWRANEVLEWIEAKAEA
ncbi:helix-turn-helix transcriptional regulator [Acinetobacter sp. HY1485]|uniref:helix-turn-helix transcriptional regulator n=1 Tax=Acinetobacter sp. HY1485 TaxID=2970918 RepID=UPI0022B9C006|nr:AlpA family phage regulatory protein [Acinetobacter sp. HY1485]